MARCSTDTPRCQRDRADRLTFGAIRGIRICSAASLLSAAAARVHGAVVHVDAGLDAVAWLNRF